MALHMQTDDHAGAILSLFASLVLASASSGADLPARTRPVPSEGQGVRFAQIVIQRTTIVRVPAAPPTLRPAAPSEWQEKDAPKCVKWSNLAAALVSSPTTIDLIVRGGTRYRVKLEKSCQAIDFYQGFYVKQTPDGQICKNRDSIHSRAGGECVIDKFRTLVPVK
jgi:hypothetical protein